MFDHLNPITLAVDMSPDSNESETTNSLLAGVPEANKPAAANAASSLHTTNPGYKLVNDGRLCSNHRR